jgi:hypothetical protein
MAKKYKDFDTTSNMFETETEKKSKQKKLDTRRRDSNISPFLSFIKQIEPQFLTTLHYSTINQPTMMNTPDNRFLISRTSMCEIEKLGPDNTLRWVENKGYDLAYILRKSIEEIIFKISCKSIQDYTFPKRGRNTGGSIVVKNLHGEKSESEEHNNVKKGEWDILLIVQRQKQKDKIPFEVGITTYDEIKSELAKSGSQIKWRIDERRLLYHHVSEEWLPEPTKDQSDAKDIYFSHQLREFLSGQLSYEGVPREKIHEKIQKLL